jgi:3-oxoacyl-[acyl-carrier-protein] synthase-3
VAAGIGATRAAGIDLNSSCTGFLAALSAATAYIESGRAKHVVVVGVDAPSRFVDPDDRDTAPLFGDGAGAAVLSHCAGDSRIGPVVMRSDDSARTHIQVTRADPVVRMNGHDTYRRAITALADATVKAVEAAGTELSAIDLFVYHQANGRILGAVADRIGVAEDRVVDCIEDYANTAAASIPIALVAASDAGRLNAGSRIVIGACGAGFTWGACVVEWGAPQGGDHAVA